MRVLLIALLAAISYAQTEFDITKLGYPDPPITVQRDGVDCNVHTYGNVGDYACPESALRQLKIIPTSDASDCVEDLPNDVTWFSQFSVPWTSVCDFGGMKECLEYTGDRTGWQLYTIICPTPTQNPTLAPSTNPTSEPSANPTLAPSAHPTSEPSANPTLAPSAPPTLQPTTTTTTTTQSSGEPEESCKYPVDVCRLIKIFDDERNDARCPDGCTGCFIGGDCVAYNSAGGPANTAECTNGGGKDCTNTVTWVERPRDYPEVDIELYQRRSKAERFDGACKRINSVVKEDNNFEHTEDSCTVTHEETKKIWRQMQRLCWQGHKDKMGEDGKTIRVPKTGEDLRKYWVRVQRRLRGCRVQEGANENCQNPPVCLLDMYDAHESNCMENN